jgi:hypothetical protein
MAAKRKKVVPLPVGEQICARPTSPLSDAKARKYFRIFEKMAGPNWTQSLTPETVLQAVLADPRHPLRAEYEWDVNKAARAHWLERTRWLMQQISIRGILHRGKERILYHRGALQRMPEQPGSEKGYKDIREVEKNANNDTLITKSRLKLLRQWVSTTRGVVASLEKNKRPPPVLSAVLDAVEQALAQADAALKPRGKAAA